MAHDVFISYSSKDKPIADGICANLEAAGLRCWIAPRDILPGEDWPTAITQAITNSRAMVLIFSASSNSSQDVSREIILAANHNLIIIPFKIENIEPEPGKQYYLARTHWLEAMNPPTREQILALVETVQAVLTPREGDLPTRTLPTNAPTVRGKSKRIGKYIWLAGFLVLVILGFLSLPSLKARFLPQPTPTATATLTPQPTQTAQPSPTPTETLVPSATPTTGTVTGQVMWGDQPFEGVTLVLCADPVFSGYCKEKSAEIVSDAQGMYTFSEVEPGKYTLIYFSPGDLGLMFHKDGIPVEVAAGQTLSIDPLTGVCKYNFSASTPILNKDNSVTLNWSAHPSNEYSWWFEKIDTGGDREYWIHYRSVTTGDFDPGRYVFKVRANGYGGTGYSCSIMWFTIP